MILTLPLLKAGLTAQIVGGNDGGFDVGSSALSDAMLIDLLLEAGGLWQQRWGYPVEAVHTVEIQRGSGTNMMQTRYTPIAYINHIYIVYPGTSSQNLVDVWSANSVVVTPETGKILNYNPFMFQTAGYLTVFPSGSPIQIDYVYGYPMTTLASDAAQGATSLALGSGFGFAPQQDYTIYDGARTERVTTASTYVAGANTLTLAAGTQYAHTAAATLAVTNLPMALIRATRRVVERRVLGRDSRALPGVRSRVTGETSRLQESYSEVAALPADELAALDATFDLNSGSVV